MSSFVDITKTTHMKKILTIIAAASLLGAGTALAQPRMAPEAAKWLREDNTRAGNNTNSYEFHTIKETPAPKGYKGNISRYCTHLDLLKEAKKNADYVMLKYIFDSQTEPDQKASFTMDELKEASHKGLIDRHVYALGGMNLDTIKAVKDLGFGGIVISGDLWNRFNIHQELEYQALIDHFCKIRKAIG